MNAFWTPPDIQTQLDRIEDKLDWLHAQAFVDTAERWRDDPKAKVPWPGDRPKEKPNKE